MGGREELSKRIEALAEALATTAALLAETRASLERANTERARMREHLEESRRDRADLRGRVETFEIAARVRATAATPPAAVTLARQDGLRIEQFEAEGLIWTCAVKANTLFDPDAARAAAKRVTGRLADQPVAEVLQLRPPAS